MATPTPTVQPTRYQVNCLPEDDVNAPHYAITVEYRGRDQWAVCRHGECLDVHGTWDYEPRPSERDDEWLVTHRFTLDTALRLAKKAAPLVTVNGWTVDRVLANRADRP